MLPLTCGMFGFFNFAAGRDAAEGRHVKGCPMQRVPESAGGGERRRVMEVSLGMMAKGRSIENGRRPSMNRGLRPSRAALAVTRSLSCAVIEIRCRGEPCRCNDAAYDGNASKERRRGVAGRRAHRENHACFHARPPST